MIWHTKRIEEIVRRCHLYYLLHAYSVANDLACKEYPRDRQWCHLYYLLHAYSLANDLACKENRRDQQWCHLYYLYCLHIRWQMIWHAMRLEEIDRRCHLYYLMLVSWQMIWHTKRFEDIDWRCQVYYLLHAYSLIKDMACKENRRDRKWCHLYYLLHACSKANDLASKENRRDWKEMSSLLSTACIFGGKWSGKQR